MQRKNKFKLVTFAMLLALLPSMNFEVISQAFNNGHVEQASLGKVFSPQETEAKTPSNQGVIKSNVPARSNTFQAVTIPQPSRPALNMVLPTEALKGTSFGYQQSIAGLTGVVAGQIEVIKNGTSVQNYVGVTDANVKAALQYIYSNADNSADFVLFVGGNVTLTASTTANTTAGGTFASLSGKVKSITVVANTTDNLASTPNVAAAGSYTITTPGNNYFGASTVFRNVNVAATNNNFYAQGNAMAFMPGSNFTGGGISVYGGTDGTSDVTGDTNLYVGSTGTGTMSFYGGNASDGTISGNTHVSITNASGLGTVTGGNASGGTISGDTNVSVTGFTGNVANMSGAGVGTSANPVTVNGNVYNNWNSSIAGARYDGSYYGGAIYGTIKGTIYNTFKGLGAYTGGQKYFNGGSQNGTIGISGKTSTTIANDYDTSGFTGGFASFAGISGANNTTGGGSNNRKMTTYGNVINYVKTSYGTGSTSYIGGAAGGYGSDYNGSQKMPVSGTSVDANPTAYAATAEAAADEKLYGDAYTWLQAGLIGSGSDYNIVLGGGYGFVKGNTVMEVGDGSTAPGGNTTGENGVVDGSRSSSNRTGIGGSGFVSIGDSADGTNARTIANNGISYNGANTNLANSYYLNDIVGGGGNDAGNGSNYWQVGDSYLIQNNSAARWTYGSGWSGNQVGNSYNFNNGSVTDTLEGGMYGNGGNVYGNTSAQFNNGQTDWFLSGGAWNGRYISGDMTTVINNGVIPANTGGNYALSGSNITKGNSSVYIYGGDFSNAPRQDGPKTVCGGNFNSGNSFVYGDSSLTLDLTGPTGNTFKFPAQNTYLSAGPGYNKNNVTSGTDASNTINLTIRANAATATKLASARIYGDGSDSSNVKAGTINMTIDAEGATVGEVYASNRSIISSSGLSRNVVTKIGEGTTIAGSVNNSAQSDNLTSAYANANNLISSVQFGDGSGDIANPIKITGKVANFKTAEVMPNVNTTVSGGLLNGANATAANHAGTYATSGDIMLDDNATLAVSTTTSVVSGAKLIVGKNVQLSSPYTNTAGLMNFSDLDMSESDARLSWIPTGTAVPPTTTYAGAYWGTQKGFPVLTFNGGDTSKGSGAFNITPGNFQGIDAGNNYAFLGDYTMNSLISPSNPTWIGYVVPGQIRVFNTTGLNSSTGNWAYNLPGVTTGTPTPGIAMQAWSSASPNTPTSSFELKYTMNYNPDLSQVPNGQPFSFDSNAPGYIKSRSASAYNGNVLNNYPATNPNFDINAGTPGASRHLATSDYFVGNRLDGTNDNASFGSYIIQNVVTDNTTSLSAGNYILPTTAATSLNMTQLQQIANLKGVGVMSDISATSGIVSTINTAGTVVQAPTSPATNVAGKSYAQIPMTWTLGTSTAQTNIVVVPQTAVVSTDHQTAVNAYDAGMTGDDANDLQDQADLDDNWTYALGFKADGTVEAPTISAPVGLISTLQTIVAGDPLIDVNDNIDPVTYTYNGVSKNIILNLSFGSIVLTPPLVYDFGTLDVRPVPLTAWALSPSSDVSVTDTRSGRGLKPWYVTVRQSVDLQGVSNGNNLSPYLIFKEGTTTEQITSAALQVYANTTPTTGTFNLSQNWKSSIGQGIQLTIPVQSQIKGDYRGELTWTLNDTPTN